MNLLINDRTKWELRHSYEHAGLFVEQLFIFRPITINGYHQ